MSNPNCYICYSFNNYKAFSATVLNKHKVDYFYCESCGSLQTEQPYWLEEAYNSPIADADTGLLKRNLVIAEQLSVLLHFGLGVADDQCLDAAGGYGTLTRLMRDIGFSFFWDDPYCDNVLAKGFAKSDNVYSLYKVVTAFEVLEHVQRPTEFVNDLLVSTGADTLVFSTELFKGDAPRPDWWYYVFATGQHVSFYQKRTLQTIADNLGLQFRSHAGLHTFSKFSLPQPWVYKLLVGRHWLRPVLAYFARKQRKSLTQQDHKALLHS